MPLVAHCMLLVGDNTNALPFPAARCGGPMWVSCFASVAPGVATLLDFVTVCRRPLKPPCNRKTRKCVLGRQNTTTRVGVPCSNDPRDASHYIISTIVKSRIFLLFGSYIFLVSMFFSHLFPKRVYKVLLYTLYVEHSNASLNDQRDQP